jgi:hypothetical protein
MAILVALATFTLAVLLHGLAMRLQMRLDSVRRFLLVGAPLGLALVAFALTRFGFTHEAFAAILLYAMLCELYMFCFTLVISSVSVTMMILLRQGPVENSKLLAVYEPDEMVQLRVGRLIKTGLLRQDGKHLLVTEKGAKLHRIFFQLRRFFHHIG